jgi:hypothetical protein
MRPRLLSFMLLAVCCLLVPSAVADVYVISVTRFEQGRKVESLGSAVCVGTLKNPVSALFCTAAHTVRDNPNSVWVTLNDGFGWRECRNVRMHPRDDLATFELVGVKLDGIPVATGVREKIPVSICGYGPQLQKQKDRFCFRGTLYKGYIRGENGKHPIPGDSGGAVLAQAENGRDVVAGIVHGYASAVQMETRDDSAGVRPLTGYVSADVIENWIRTQYGGCPTCPISIYPEVRQPMVGIGIPVGPPRVVGVAGPAMPRYQQIDESPRYGEPVQAQRPDFGGEVVEQRIVNEDVVDAAVMRYFAKNPVRDGRDGRDGQTPSTDRVIQIIDAIIEARPERFRGENGVSATPEQVAAVLARDYADQLRGPAGPAGQIGVLDDADMRAMVRGWLSDPETRTWLVGELSQDMRIQDLIKRLEAVEKRGGLTGEPSTGNGGTLVSRFVLVKSGPNSRVDSAVASAKKYWTDIVEVSKEEIPKNVIVKSYPTLIAFSPTGDVAGMWDSEFSVLNTLARISSGQYP